MLFSAKIFSGRRHHLYCTCSSIRFSPNSQRKMLSRKAYTDKDGQTLYQRVYFFSKTSPFPKLGFAPLLETNELPAHERVVVWIRISRVKASSPVNLHKTEHKSKHAPQEITNSNFLTVFFNRTGDGCSFRNLSVSQCFAPTTCQAAPFRPVKSSP